jgi:hypothetical protein
VSGPYDLLGAQLPGIFNGSHPDLQIITALPQRLQDLLTTRYLSLLRHPRSPQSRVDPQQHLHRLDATGYRCGCMPPAATPP